MSEKDANAALECYYDRQAAERAKWAQVLAPTKAHRTAQKKNRLFWFWFK